VELDAPAARTREFIRAEVLEIDDRHDGAIKAAGGDGLQVRLQALAVKAGLLAGPRAR
jgi:acyl-CoA dehydrogenase